MSLRHLIILVVFVFVCLPPVAVAAQALDKEYVSDLKESGIGVAIRPPVGWGANEYAASLVFTKDEVGSIGIQAFSSHGGTMWKAFQEEYSSYAVGDNAEGFKVLAKGKGRVAGQSALYILVQGYGSVYKHYYFSYGGYVYRFQIAAEQDEWEKLRPVLEKSLATARMLAKKGEQKVVAPKKLAGPYIMTGGKNGFDFSIRPPVGWEVRADASGVDITDPKLPSGAGGLIAISQQSDLGGEWEASQKLIRILNDKQFKNFVELVVAEELGHYSGVDVVSTQKEVKMNGNSSGWSAEFRYQIYGILVNAKLFAFKGNDNIYYVIIASTENEGKNWSGYKGILEKSVKTLRLLD